MKSLFTLLIPILILCLINTSYEYNCPETNKISITALGKCETIENLLENENLELKTENLLYLASNNDRKIAKNGYKLEIFKLNDPRLQSHNKRKSKIYIPNSCLKGMENDIEIKLNKSMGIIILVSDYNNLNKNNIPNNYFIIRHNSENSKKKYINSKNYEFNFCSEDPILYEDEINLDELNYNLMENETIKLDTINYVKKYRIDLFDPYSVFFNDICFKFKSENGYDVTLESRVEDYYQNVTFCNESENAHYLSNNFTDKKFTYRCAFGFYKNENEKSNYLDIIDSELKTLVSVSNIKVVTCFKKFLNLKDIIHNYGGMMCIIVLIIQIICFLLFCFLGLKSIKRQLNDLFILGTEIIRRQSVIKETRLNIEKETDNDSITNINNPTDEKQQALKNEEKNASNPPKKEITNENKDDVIKIEKEKENEIKEKNSIEEENKISLKEELQSRNLEKKIIEKKLTSSTIKKEKQKKEADKETNIDIKSEKSENSQLYEYENEELNELPFDKAIKNDKRGFCGYFCNILVISHIILNVFFRQSDYNLFIVKLGLLLMTFPINLTFNIMFFTNKTIKLNYLQSVKSMKSMEDVSLFWRNISSSVYSSLISSIFLIMLKFICLTHNSVRKLRKIKDVKIAKQKSVCILRCIKIRITLYYLLSFVFLILFGFYVLCFSSVFENTQMLLVKTTFTSWLISLIFPFVICFITSIFRSLALSCKSKCLYIFKQLLQLL